MDNHRFLLNKDLLNQQTLKKIKVPDSYDTILNLLTTVKEYREYAHPNSASWIEYIQEFFHLLGFSTKFHNPRMLILSEMGQTRSPQILVGISLPEEGLFHIVPWLNWSDLLSLTASSMNIQWGILTNGIELQIYDFTLKEFTEKYYWANIEKIIRQSSDESFYSLYKVLFFLRHRLEISHGVETKTKPEVKKTPEPINNRRQFYNIQVGKTENSEPERDPHISVLRTIDLYQEMSNNGISFDQACVVVAKKYGISSATVRHDLSARLHINSDKFCSLINNKIEFISHLKFCFPRESDNIDYLLEK